MKKYIRVLTVVALVFGSAGVGIATKNVFEAVYEVMMFLLIFVLGYFVGANHELEHWMKIYRNR